MFIKSFAAANVFTFENKQCWEYLGIWQFAVNKLISLNEDNKLLPDGKIIANIYFIVICVFVVE